MERKDSDSDFITAIEADSATQDMLYKPRNFPTKINFVLSGSFRYKRRPKKEFFLKKNCSGDKVAQNSHIWIICKNLHSDEVLKCS